MQYKDYYKILGVSRDAGQDEIKRAFRKLARRYHPDVSKEANAEARFKEINEAHEVLRDPEKRAAYDHLGRSWREGQEFRPPPGAGSFRHTHFSSGMGPGDASHFSDFFESLFGADFGGGAQGFRARGANQRANVQISLEDSFNGAVRSLDLDVPEQDAQGRMSLRRRSLRVRIPAGITEGRQIRLAGQGTPGKAGARAGDLYLEVRFAPHRLFRAEGRDIHLSLPIAPWEAALGAILSVPTLGGSVSLKIPPGSQSGRRMRLKGRGLPGDPPGDQYLTLQIAVPEARSERIKKAYRELAEAAPFDPRKALK